MNKYLIQKLIFLFLCCFVVNAHSKERVAEFKGSGNTTTAEFEVTAPWVLDWIVTSEFPASLGLQVDLVDARSGQYLGKAAKTKWVSDGVRLFTESGRFRFNVSSTFATWSLRVEQLSRQEAETYKPKER